MKQDGACSSPTRSKGSHRAGSLLRRFDAPPPATLCPTQALSPLDSFPNAHGTNPGPDPAFAPTRSPVKVGSPAHLSAWPSLCRTSVMRLAPVTASRTNYRLRNLISGLMAPTKSHFPRRRRPCHERRLQRGQNHLRTAMTSEWPVEHRLHPKCLARRSKRTSRVW